MNFAAHGQYQIVVQKRVVEITAVGVWNDLTAKSFFSELDERVNAFNGESFGCLVDLRLWELGTPEMQQAVLERTHEMIERGLVKDAYVVGIGQVKQAQVAAMTPKSEGYERQYFETHLEALLWLKVGGFAIY